MLTVKRLSKRFFNNDVLCNIALDVAAGEVVGLIGHSGAGKSTLARCLVGLEKTLTGEITLDGKSIQPGQGSARQDIQYLWQDPMQALSPYLTAHAAVLETLSGFNIGSRGSRATQATELLDGLGIDAATALRELHVQSGVTMLIVSHDLAPLRHLAQRIVLLDEGKIAEDLPLARFFSEARHPLSRAYAAL